GGGVWNHDVAGLTNVTVAENSTSAGMGGGLWSDAAVVLMSCTIAGNGASASGGIVKSGGGTFEVQNTIFSSNTPENCSGGINSDGHRDHRTDHAHAAPSRHPPASRPDDLHHPRHGDEHQRHDHDDHRLHDHHARPRDNDPPRCPDNHHTRCHDDPHARCHDNHHA